MSELEYQRVSVLSMVAFASSLVAVTTFPFSSRLVFAVAALWPKHSSVRSLAGRLAIASICIAGVTSIVAPSWECYLFRSASLPGYVRVDLAAAKVRRSMALVQDANTKQSASRAICFHRADLD